jgi:repressor LexA
MEYSVLEALIRQRGTTVYRVSKATGIPASTFTDWKNGRSVPKAEKLLRIAKYFELTLDELLDGALPRPGLGRGLCHRIPVIGQIRAGSPIITEESRIGEEYAEVNDPEEYFYLRVCGDSMKNCGMIDGSLVLFRKQQYASDGEIVACLVGGDSATVKRFRKQQRKILLQPENEAYEPIVLSPEDFESGEARILGVAVEIKIKL